MTAYEGMVDLRSLILVYKNMRCIATYVTARVDDQSLLVIEDNAPEARFRHPLSFANTTHLLKSFACA